MKIWFDTEFMEDGKTIELLSIGMVRADGKELYLENLNADYRHANPWVRENVLPHLDLPKYGVAHKEMVDRIMLFVGNEPEFWAYYGAYDWVALCQLHGRMVDLPRDWPMWCRDVKQLCAFKGNPPLPEQLGIEHHALADARWTKDAYDYLIELPVPPRRACS